MSAPSTADNPLAPTQAQEIRATLAEIKAWLEEAGELLAAVNIEHALQCLDPEHPLNRERRRKGQ